MGPLKFAAKLLSLFKYFESNSLFCNNCHSLCFCSIMHGHSGYGEGNGVTADFSGAVSVDFHPIYVANNTLLPSSALYSIINIVLAVPS